MANISIYQKIKLAVIFVLGSCFLVIYSGSTESNRYQWHSSKSAVLDTKTGVVYDFNSMRQYDITEMKRRKIK